MDDTTPPASEQSDIALDLDALAPKTVTIKYQDKEVTVHPPTLEQFAQIMDLGEDATKLENATDLKAAAPIYEKIKGFVISVIPDLKDEVLNHLQILALFKLLVSISTPADDKAMAELAKRGIEINQGGDGDPKASTSSEPLPVS